MNEILNAKEHYDVGIFGVWSGCNYGSIATYYALNQIVSSMGKTVLMIDKPILTDDDVELKETHSRRFAREHYNISKQYKLNQMQALNGLCDAFLIGSDQVWNYGISKNFGKAFYLDFADDEKKKIAYGVSFGHGVDFAPDKERKIISEYMSRFDGIGTREADGVRICKEDYGIRAQQVLDPVFLADPQIYDPLIEKASQKEEGEFIVTYILDPSPEKRKAILHLQKEFGNVKVINLLEGLPWLFEKNKKLMDLPNCIENLQVEDWLYYLKNAKFVLTDSCHGASFALIFRKKFIAITNKARGFSRFQSLAQLFKFEDHLISNPNDILTNPKLLAPINYEIIDNIMSAERKHCYKWLYDILTMPKKEIEDVMKVNVIGKPKKDKKEVAVSKDFSRCRMAVSLLKSYGIKHIVLSSGSRNLNLARLFEHNSYFKTYPVIDERSAAFYALGIALQTREPVVICCTSGTAVSNYLSGITEAFYQGVPLIVLSTDRYPCLLGQTEDQTIPQMSVFHDVIKKAVSLPVTDGYLGDWESRRLICDALLEIDHHGKGPVQINIPIATIERPVPPKEAYVLPKYRTIERIMPTDTDAVWKKRVERLQQMKRILVVYGQKTPLDEKKKNLLKEFTDRFNCVVITDLLSNFKSDDSIQSLNILRSISNEEFNEKLAPDIVITFGGKRMLNDPILPRLRAQKKSLGHWRISEDGAVADPYRKLSRVFECSMEYFLSKFNELSDKKKKNDGVYLQEWNELNSQVLPDTTNDYSQLYSINKIVEAIPEGSLVHLGIGNTIMFANRFKIANDVEVFCNMGTNGIDGSASTFMGHAVVTKKKCFLLISDLSFFYDMNSVFNKKLTSNIRIMLCNNSGTNLLRHLKSDAITHAHTISAKGWVESVGFEYITANTKEEFDRQLQYFVSDDANNAIFWEVFC